MTRLAGLALFLLAAPASAQTARAPATPPDSVRALLRLARLQSGKKDAAGALESLGRARKIAPNSEEVLSAYAQVSLAAGKPLPAILALEPLTRICPGVAQHHYLLGVALLQAGDHVAATESLRRARELEPDRPLTLIALGLALNTGKRYAEARPFLVRSLELAPDDVEALAALAEAEAGLGELQPAEEHAQRALSRRQGHATANLVMGLLRMKQERYAEARDAFQRAVAAEPASSKAQYQLSLAYARLNDDANASQHLDLYRLRLKEMEERVRELRGETRETGAESHP